MRADHKVRQIGIEQQVAADWLAAQMQTLSNAGRLKPLDAWLKMVRPRPKRAASMIEAFQALADRGAPITVKITEG